MAKAKEPLDFQMVFAVKKGTDSTLLWKATVRVACVKVDATTKEIDSYRFVPLACAELEPVL